MDSARFDALARSLTAAGSRRRALTAVLTGGLSLLGLAQPDDAAAAKSGKCKPKCGECERCKKGDCEKKNRKKRCQKGKCKPKANGTLCSNERACQNGACVCPGGLTDCGGACVNTSTDPRNCGSCGKRCQINGRCTGGTCTCVQSGCPDPAASCCATGQPCLCAPSGGSLFAGGDSCAVISAPECPAGYDECVGPPGTCQACCPSGSTCDPTTGSCLQ